MYIFDFCICSQIEAIQDKLSEREAKYDLLAAEFTSLQKTFAAYKASREEVNFSNIIFW